MQTWVYKYRLIPFPEPAKEEQLFRSFFWKRSTGVRRSGVNTWTHKSMWTSPRRDKLTLRLLVWCSKKYTSLRRTCFYQTYGPELDRGSKSLQEKNKRDRWSPGTQAAKSTLLGNSTRRTIGFFNNKFEARNKQREGYLRLEEIWKSYLPDATCGLHFDPALNKPNVRHPWSKWGNLNTDWVFAILRNSSLSLQLLLPLGGRAELPWTLSWLPSPVEGDRSDGHKLQD